VSGPGVAITTAATARKEMNVPLIFPIFADAVRVALLVAGKRSR
jgi:hypothetical protein